MILTYNPAGYNVAVGEPPGMRQVRCDTNAPPLMHSGCVFWQVVGTFRLSRTDPNAKESVLFIERAQNFLPTHPGKPGVRPLTRATEIQRLANRAVSGQACKPLQGTIQGYDCDEYPFAAAVEGAASGPRYVNWDIALVTSGHNRRVGGLLSAFHQDQRMFYGDRFYVEVGP